MEDINEELNPCEVCEAKASQRCSGCQSVFYCSRDHQRQDWKTHRLTCRAYRIESNPIVGRHLVACRDLKPGDIILEESPLVMGPKQNSRPLCLGCYKDVDCSFVCPRCGWPMCGPECCSKPQHAAECQITPTGAREKIKVESSKEVQPMYDSVMVLRCLHLKETQPAQWQQLMKLQSHSDQRKQSGLEDMDRNVIVRFIRETLELEPSDELMMQLCGIIFVNSFEMPFNKQAVFATASLFEHDCVANATRSFTVQGKIVIRATVPISRGENISLNYIDPLWGTTNRQHILKQGKFFQCQCERCKDPTELGTFLSGLSCPHCKCVKHGAILLPQRPLQTQSPWECTLCNQTQSAKYVEDLIEKIGKELVELKRGSIKQCERFLKKYEDVLHPHHFYMIDVKLALCQMYGHLEGQKLIDLTDDELNAKESLCLELLKLVDVLSPGMNRLRGVILYELQAVFSVRSRKTYLANDISKQELISHVKIVRKMLQEAGTIFSWESEETEEGRLAQITKMELNDVNLFLRTIQ